MSNVLRHIEKKLKESKARYDAAEAVAREEVEAALEPKFKVGDGGWTKEAIDAAAIKGTRDAAAIKGTRKECGKRFDLLHPAFVEAMAEIASYGANKYGENNWKKGLHGENGGINHALKHIMEYQAGAPNDFGENRMHLAQAAFNLMFEFYFDENANG